MMPLQTRASCVLLLALTAERSVTAALVFTAVTFAVTSAVTSAVISAVTFALTSAVTSAALMLQSGGI